MVVVEALLSSLFEVVIEKLMVSPLLEYARRLKVDPTPLQHWNTTLLQIKSVLNDAEQRQIQDDAAVMGWLDDLKALACDIEDVVDEIETEALRRSSLGVKAPQTSKVRKLMIPSFDHINFNKKKVGKKMNTITEMLDAIVKQKNVLGLREGLGGVDRHEGVGPSINRERQTTSLVTVPKVYGREADTEKIIKLLLSDEVASAPQVQVMPIVGMGGIGKTTLAQSIYNHKRVKENFQIHGWACVSDQFHLETVTKQILESVSGFNSGSQSSLQLLQTSLQNDLNGKKFFLVLDDVWTENPDAWSKLQAPLMGGAAGSVILVTTRSERVASIMRTTPPQPLRELTEEDSWSLFAYIAFQNITPDARQTLEPIGRRIIKKCKGLPLALKTLAGLLRSKQDENTWEKMLRNEIWDLPLQQSSILPVLHLSYHYLPSSLKQCFAYCSIFPKDNEFDKEELILLWAAQGFLGGSGLKSGKTIKDFGERCFDALLSRSFFQQSGGNYSSFLMHDMIHDLAQFVSRNFCLTLGVEGQYKISERTRHVSYIREPFDVSKRFDSLHRAHKLRTFLSLTKSIISSSNIADKVLRDLLPTFECLRVLSLSHYDIAHLPDSFRNLKHLRYLNLSHTRIEKLPQSICVLLNLQLLLLSHCRKLIELPAEIGKLIHLIHLDVSETNIQGMPVEIGKLINLIHLDVSKTKIQEMPVEIGKLINLIHLDVSKTKIQEMPVEIGKLVNLLHLDIFNTRVEGMPAGIGKLKDLRRLRTFVVGKHSGATASIAELRDLSHLQGALSILNLQNVVNAVDALEANLKEKKGIDDLEFEWDPKNVVDVDLNNQTDVLEKLQPHTNVKRLRIQHYNGTKFPKWLGDLSFINIVSLLLEDCSSCSCLPPLGQLQSLKDLRIVKMEAVEKVGVEFYGNDGYGSSSAIKPFGSLEILWFEEMLKWEEWVCCRVEFPSLKELYIKKCPKLKGDHIHKCHPQYSTNIEVSECGQLMCGLPLAPCIRELTLEECDDVVVRSAGDLTSLASLKMRNVCKLPSELGQLHSLVKLVVSCCPELKEIPPILHNLTSLKHLVISRCESLFSLSEMVVPPMLEILKLSYCAILESLPEGMMQNNTHLQDLEIYHCKKLELSLDDQDMTHNHYASSLTSIKISESCLSLISFPLAFFTKLEHLFISQCRDLESLYIPDGLHHVDLTYLQSLDINNCPKLVSFPQGGLPTPNLTSLRISWCPKLKTLPQGMDSLLTSLQRLSIYNCPEIDSFPDGGLPTTLSYLNIYDCNKLVTCRMEWGLHTLPCLTSLRVNGHNKEQIWEKSLIPEEERFLPSSLTHLRIEDFPNLKCLHNKGLQHLTSLMIFSFPNLKSLDDNEFQHLKSLQTMDIRACEKLKYLPKQGLPSSLSSLYIACCPLLLKRCQWNEGKEWPKISHIPCVILKP